MERFGSANEGLQEAALLPHIRLAFPLHALQAQDLASQKGLSVYLIHLLNLAPVPAHARNNGAEIVKE